METSKFEKKRGRVKKKIEAALTSFSISEGLDNFDESPLPFSEEVTDFSQSPEFRARTSSNASSCGRLSPIPPALESVSPLSPLNQWSELNLSEAYTDRLVEMANTMKLGTSSNSTAGTSSRGSSGSSGYLSAGGGYNSTTGFLTHNHPLPNDVDLDSLQGGLVCDVNSVIQHELNLDGNLDFDFDPTNIHNHSTAANHHPIMFLSENGMAHTI